MSINNIFISALTKMNTNQSIKQKLKELLKEERVLSINIDDEIPIVRVIIKGIKEDLILDEMPLLNISKKIGSKISQVSEKYKIYLIDERYEIVVVINEKQELNYDEY